MLTLPPQVIFLFAIVGVLAFGANDPARFGSTQIAMVSLFQIGTFASWSEMFKANYFGCDVYDADIYLLSPERMTVSTQFGTFDGYGCYAPKHNRQ